MPVTTSSTLTALQAVASQPRGDGLVELRWSQQRGDYRKHRMASWSGVVDSARRFVAALDAAGIGRGERVAVLLDNSIEMVVSEWACLLGARLWVALNVRSSAAENATILAQADARLLVIARSRLGSVDRAKLPALCRVLVVEDQAEAGAEAVEAEQWAAFLEIEPSPSSPPSATDPVRIRFTSGTSGLPKGAVLSLDGYDASLEAVGKVLGELGCTDSVVQVAPMTHASGAMLLPHAVVGARALLLDHFDAAALVRLIEAEQATAMFLVPTMLTRVLEEVGRGSIATMRSIVYGGAAMPAERLAAGVDRLGQVFIGIYGLTESTWPVTALARREHPLDDESGDRMKRLASCGRPTEVGDLRICRVNGSECDPEEPGEILVRGRNTMLGYWDRDQGCAVRSLHDESKGLDRQGWMHTGDVAFRDAQGFITIVDRRDDLIISGGFNIYPREVEEALATHPAVLEAAVVGRSHPDWGNVVVAFVVCRAGHGVAVEELALHCASRTAAYKKPREIHFVEALPRNAAGKVLRRSLRDQAGELASAPV